MNYLWFVEKRVNYVILETKYPPRLKNKKKKLGDRTIVYYVRIEIFKRIKITDFLKNEGGTLFIFI